jgi:hypothetical protein
MELAFTVKIEVPDLEEGSDEEADVTTAIQEAIEENIPDTVYYTDDEDEETEYTVNVTHVEQA